MATYLTMRGTLTSVIWSVRHIITLCNNMFATWLNDLSDHLRNDLYCVGWALNSTHSLTPDILYI